MISRMEETGTKLSRREASDAVAEFGWRLTLGEFTTQVLTRSLPLAADVAGRAAALPGADGHLRMDVRSDRVLLSVQTLALGWVTPHDVELARRISAVVRDELRLDTASAPAGARAVQVLEIAIDALDIGKVRPFWKAVLGYTEDAGSGDALIDPAGGPAVWFQQMDVPRDQRNRIHLDVSVPHDEAHERIQATLAAGGKLLGDAEAPSFWVLADPEGNEACITTWQGRDG